MVRKGKGCAGEASIPSSKVAPFFVGSLFLNEGLKVKLRVELVRLCAGVREDSLLVKAFGYLNKHQVRGEHQRERGIFDTSRICLGAILSMREPVFCSSTVVSGRGFLGGYWA